MTGKAINRIILLLVIALLIFSCSRNRNIIFTDTVTMPDAIWRLTDNPEFGVVVSDTAMHTDVFFSIRTGSAYPFRNLWLFVTASSPDGKTSLTDTLQYELADQKGEWLGKGFGNIHELKLPYRQNVFFPARGTYHFKLQHGMRVGDLKDVYDFGLRVEKTSR